MLLKEDVSQNFPPPGFHWFIHVHLYSSKVILQMNYTVMGYYTTTSWRLDSFGIKMSVWLLLAYSGSSKAVLPQFLKWWGKKVSKS